MNDQGQGINNEPGLTEAQVIRLAQSSRWKNKLIAAQNSGCPPAILDELAHQKRHSDELQRAVAGNPATASITLEFLGHQQLLKPLVALHPSTGMKTLAWLVQTSSDYVRELILKRQELSTPVLENLAAYGGPEVRRKVALRVDCSPEILDSLKLDTEFSVLCAVILNPSTARSVKRKLSNDLAKSSDRYTRIVAALYGSHLDPTVRTELLSDVDMSVRMGFATRADLSILEALTLAADEYDWVIRELARNESCPPTVFGELAKREEPFAVFGLLSNTKIPDLMRETLILWTAVGGNHGFPTREWLSDNSARLLLARDPNCESEILQKLAATEAKALSMLRIKAELRGIEEVIWQLLRHPKLDAKSKSVLQSNLEKFKANRISLPSEIPQSLDSPPEEVFWATCERLHLTELAGMTPNLQVGRYRLDFRIPTSKLGIEVDGLAFHNGQKSFREDRERQRQLEIMGWRLLRFTALEVQSDPERCVRQSAEWVQALANWKPTVALD